MIDGLLQAARRPGARQTHVSERTLWLARGQAELRTYLSSLGLEAPRPVMVAGGATDARHVLGQCYPSDQHPPVIVVSDRITKGSTALGVLLHELIHAALPEDEEHGPAFRAWARCVGLIGPVGATKPGPRLLPKLAVIQKRIGPLPPAERGYLLTEQGWALA